MRAFRPLLLTGLLLTALPVAPATPGARTAAILEEVQNHLDQAEKCVEDGSSDLAIAHVNMVLVDDDVSVGVRFEGVPLSEQNRALKNLDTALGTWEDALKDTIHFHRTTDLSKAELLVRFRPDVRMGNEQVAGYANWKRVIKTDHNGRLLDQHFSADLQIRTNMPDMGAMPPAAMRHEIMHEVGHILGLEDSDRTGDLMGPLDVTHPVAGPQTYETEAVWQLREEAKKIQKQALAESHNS